MTVEVRCCLEEWWWGSIKSISSLPHSLRPMLHQLSKLSYSHSSPVSSLRTHPSTPLPSPYNPLLQSSYIPSSSLLLYLILHAATVVSELWLPNTFNAKDNLLDVQYGGLHPSSSSFTASIKVRDPVSRISVPWGLYRTYHFQAQVLTSLSRALSTTHQPGRPRPDSSSPSSKTNRSYISPTVVLLPNISISPLTPSHPGCL